MVERLTKHFDEDYKSLKSSHRMGNTRGDYDSYNPVSSWEGRSQNAKAFSRLDHATEVPVQNCRPCTLSGSAVILLENPDGMKVFNVNSSALPRSSIPLTREQKEVGMVEGDLSGHIPLVSAAMESNKIVVVEKAPTFRNMKLEPPAFAAKEIPAAYVAAGPNADQALLTPAERREILEFEKSAYDASRVVRKAYADRLHTKDVMKGPFHHRGVLMVDSSDNPESEIYGDKAQREMQKIRAHEEHIARKREILSERVSSVATNGNILIPDTLAPNVVTEKLYQTKGGQVHGFSYEETKDRLFLRQNKVIDPRRTQTIRDAELYGKNYNIITGTNITVWPSKITPKEDKILAHPSQTSLESRRNLQGAVHPERFA